MGRKSTKDINDLPLGWQETVIDLMSKGKSIQYVCAELNISKKIHYRLMEESEEYAEIFELGKGKMWQWWENEGHKALDNRNYNSPIFNRMTKVLLGWDAEEKKEDASENKQKDNELLEQIFARLEKGGNKNEEAEEIH